MKILVAYDGSDCAGAALDDMRRAGLPREAEARVLTVAESWLPPPSAYALAVEAGEVGAMLAGAAVRRALATSTAKPLDEAQRLADEAAFRLSRHFPDWKVRAKAASGSPPREILKEAAVWGADLVVVGSHGRTGLGRFLLGSVSQKVVYEALCSVRVARGTGWKNGSPVRILLGLDGSPGSQAAVEAVAGRAWPPGSEVRLVIALDPSPTAAGSLPARTPIKSPGDVREPAWVRQFAEEAARRLRASELDVSTEVEEGDPKRLLVCEAEEWGADCVFVGSAGSRSRLEEFLIGSVATAVVTRAHCSVEVIRPPQKLRGRAPESPQL